ncbi:hypothetical protein PCI56_24810 [Plesiomonas shigelloides subsp. oncorhynchi]|nr:hypothetical protein [Plesiomonas shigelloides]
MSKCVHAYRMSGHMLAGRYFIYSSLYGLLFFYLRLLSTVYAGLASVIDGKKDKTCSPM